MRRHIITTILALGVCVGLAKAASANGWTLVVKSGAKSVVGQYDDVDVDCAALDSPETTIVRQPEHGRAVVEAATVKPHFPQSNRRFKCNSTPVPGKYVYYTPDAGYEGQDYLVTRSVQAGVTFEDTIIVIVDSH